MTGDRATDVLDHVPPARDGDVLEPGALVGHWRITDAIAAGGCGTVYAAGHRVLGRVAAIKVLHAALATTRSMVDRFVREARAVDQIRHPHIVDIFDFGTLADGRPYFVMELLERDNLERRVALHGRMTAPEIVAVVAPICRALDAAHRAGYIHRDLKARNIGFARTADGAEIPKLLDFGIAKLLEDGDGKTTASVRVGTPYCMSPEQIRGEPIDVRTDVYALGVLLYHLTTGRQPFESDDPVEVQRLHLDAPAPIPGRLAPVPAGIDALVASALAKQPAGRPAGALAFLDRLVDAVAPPRSRREDAVAIRVVVDVPQAVDDAILGDAVATIGRAAAFLDGTGFAPILVTGTAVIGARVVAGEATGAREHAAAVAAMIERSARGSRFAVRTSVRIGSAEIADDGSFVGGELFDVYAWPA